MKRVINTLVIVAIIAAIVLVLRMNKKTNQQKTELASMVATAVPVQIDVVGEEVFTTDFISNGVLEPIRELSFVSDVSGRVVSIAVEKGSWVQKGQKLINIDDEMLKADFTANEASYNALKTDYERFEKAKENGGVTAQQFDNIRTQLIAAESRYIVSKRRLADATIKSPISGFINERYVEVGALLNPGAKLFDIVDDSQLKLKCSITESQVLSISKGQEVNIKTDAYPSQLYSGTISFIGKKSGMGLSYPIEIVIKNKQELMTGQFVTADFKSVTQQKGILIPRNAVSGSVKSASVYVVKNGIAQQRDISIGNMVGKRVEVIQGLQAGDSIVVAGLIDVTDGVKVVNRK
ncbi:MAG: efflux RND transporter periplasmic adaptor subunit [Prolixibacteraceae bacterium]|nr:efflux RND transporter periplasmic adaptor subunit [Prolixibacteraceae bacterium]